MISNSNAAKVGLVGDQTNSSARATTSPVTNYQRFDPLMNNNLSYDSEDSQRSYASYNYMSTSIRDRINYNNNHHHHINTNKIITHCTNSGSNISSTPLTATDEQQPQLLLTEEDQQRIQYLALRKFHIPGHTFTQDYVYWFCNNHPFICFCYADSRHPLGTIERIINLVSSLAFGLAATSCVVLWFYYQNQDPTSYNNGVTDDENNTEHGDSLIKFQHVLFTIPFIDVNVTTGIATLLIFSGPLHVLFDLGIYFLQACPPCRVNGCCYYNSNNIDHYHHHYHNNAVMTSRNSNRSSYYACMRLLYRQECWLWVGTYVAFCISVAAVSLAIQVTLLRASVIEEQDNDEANISYQLNDYDFILYYLLEIFVANFIAFPIGTFTMFSGVLGCCGLLPGLGGRPYQVRKHQREQQREHRKEQLAQNRQQQILELQSIDATTIKRSNLA